MGRTPWRQQTRATPSWGRAPSRDGPTWRAGEGLRIPGGCRAGCCSHHRPPVPKQGEQETDRLTETSAEHPCGPTDMARGRACPPQAPHPPCHLFPCPIQAERGHRGQQRCPVRRGQCHPLCQDPGGGDLCIGAGPLWGHHRHHHGRECQLCGGLRPHECLEGCQRTVTQSWILAVNTHFEQEPCKWVLPRGVVFGDGGLAWTLEFRRRGSMREDFEERHCPFQDTFTQT